MGQYYRLFHRICKEHLLGENNALFKKLKETQHSRAQNERSLGQVEAEAIGCGQVMQDSGTDEGF